jgi:hypothetical protein
MKLVDGKLVPEGEEETAALKAMLETEVTGLKAKNAEILGKLKALDAHKDIDPDEYKALKGQAAKIEEERALKAGEFDNLKKQLLDAHAKEKEALVAKIATLGKSLEENVLIATATQAIAAEKGSTLLLMPHVKSRTKLDDNGNAVVLDDSGNVRIGADGKPLTIPQLIAEMKADVNVYGRAFEASGVSGSGAQQNNGSGNADKFSHLKPTDRITAAREAGLKT